MALKHRKLFPTNSTECQIYPCSEPYSYPYPDPDFFFPLPPPPPPPSPPPHFTSTVTLSPYLIISLSLFAAVSFLLTAYVILTKRCARRSRQQSDGHQDFLDHNHGPEIDHHIWYINTVGLQSSVINSIAAFKYKKGDTLVEGSTCSVCLSEFVEDETLRLLPKCNHAFHITCIDTWLRSHTNCPLCRASISSNFSRSPPGETSNRNTVLGNTVDTRGDSIIDSQNREETEDASDSKEINNSSAVSLVRENGRRSVSMDPSMETSISIDVDEFVNDKKKLNFDNNLTQDNGHLEIGSSSSVESLHTSDVSMKRSFSCSGRLFSSSKYNNSKSSSSILPL